MRQLLSTNRWRDESSTSKPPVLLKVRSSENFILLTICIAIFTDIFLYACIVPVIPFALRTRVGTPDRDIQHQVSVLLAVYGASLLAGSPIAGLFSDRMPNRRLPLLLGLLALAGATLLLCLGTNMAMLLVGRILQGLSAAVVWTVGLALLADTVGHEGIGQAIGYVSISMSIGILVAPLLGGIVYARAGYYAVYFMCFGMILLDIILRMVLVEKKVARKWLDEDAQITGEIATRESAEGEKCESSEQPAVQNTDEEGLAETVRPAVSPPASQRTPGSGGAIWLLLSSRRLLAALVCSLVGAILLTAWDATLPLFVNKVFGWSSTGGGLIFLPLVVPTLVAPLAGRWSDQKGPRWPTAGGFIILGPFCVLLRFVDHNSIKQVVLLCAMLAFIGFFVTFANVPLLAEITYIVREKEQTHPGAFGGRGAYATAYGLFNTAFAGGMLAGPLWGGLVNQKAGWGTMAWSLGLLSFCSGLLAWLFVGGALWKKRECSDAEAGQAAET